MITEAQMYWITRLDGLQNLAEATIIISATALFLMVPAIGILYSEGYFEDWECCLKRWAKRLAVAIGVAAIAGTMLPTTKEMAMIYAVPAISRSDVIKTDLPEIYDLGIKALKDKLTDEGDNE